MKAITILLLLLLSAAEIRLTLSQTQSTLQNVTLWKSGDATIQCTAYSSVYEWIGYTPYRTIIYNSNNSYNVNPSKYIVANGSSTLLIMNVDLPDGGSYCCADSNLVEVCSNVLVIGSLVASVNPSNGLNNGNLANLSCLLTYNSPVNDPSSLHPLSDDQDPQLSISIGNMDLSSQATVGEQVIGSGPIYNSKILSVNWTVTDPNGQPLTCTVSSAIPPYSNSTYTSLNYFKAASVINMTFPNNSTTPGGPYFLNSTVSITCYASGYPPPNIRIYNATTTTVVNLLTSTNNAYSRSYTVRQAGFYDVFCSVYNSLNQNGSYNSTPVSFAVVPAAGKGTTKSPPKSTLERVTPWTSMDATIKCAAYSSVFAWISYTPYRTVIYSSDTNNNTNPNKYIVENGSKTLTVMNVKLSDAGSYCCADNSLVEVCSNVVVVARLGASVIPTGRLSAGDVATLSCFMVYNPGSSTPVFNSQGPQVSISVGTDNLIGRSAVREEVVGNGTTYRIRRISLNWTVTDPNGEALTCEASSDNPFYIYSVSTPINNYVNGIGAGPGNGFGVGLRPEYTTQLLTGIIVLFLLVVIGENGRTI